MQNRLFSRARLLILNLRVRKRLSLIHAASVMFVIWLVQSHVSEKVKPKCLCNDVHFKGILFIKRGGWFTGFLDISMENVLEGLKSTNQSLAQLLICFKSL